MREVKPTQKPVPSSDIKDLFFNSGLLDIWATSLERKYIDRFGNCHLTAAGMEWIFNELVIKFKIESEQALLAAGYAPSGTFQEGAEVVSRNGTVLWKLPDGDGDHYRWDGDLPKQVPVDSTPQSTGGIGKGTWVSVGDASLRQALGAVSGADLVGGLGVYITGVKYSGGAKGDGVTDDFAALKSATEYANANKLPIMCPPGLTVKIKGSESITIKHGFDFNGSILDVSEYSGTINILRDEQTTVYNASSAVVQQLVAGGELNGRYFSGWSDNETLVNSFIRMKTSQPYYRYRGDIVNRQEMNVVIREGAMEAPLMFPLNPSLITEISVTPLPKKKLEYKNISIYVGSNENHSELLYIENSMSTYSNWTFIQDNYIYGSNPVFGSVLNSSHLIFENWNYSFPNINAEMKFTYGLYVGDSFDVEFKNVRGDGDGWGIFGGNSIQRLTFDNCKLNRIDCHKPFIEWMRILYCDIGLWGVLFTAIGDLSVIGGTHTLGRLKRKSTGAILQTRDELNGLCWGNLLVQDVAVRNYSNKYTMNMLAHSSIGTDDLPAGSPIPYTLFKTIKYENVSCLSGRVNLAPAIFEGSTIKYPESITADNCNVGEFIFNEQNYANIIPAFELPKVPTGSVDTPANCFITLNNVKINQLVSIIDSPSKATSRWLFHVKMNGVHGFNGKNPSIQLLVRGKADIDKSSIDGFNFYFGNSNNKHLDVNMSGGIINFTGTIANTILNGINTYTQVNLSGVSINAESVELLRLMSSAMMQGCTFSTNEGKLAWLTLNNDGTTSFTVPSLLAQNRYALCTGSQQNGTFKITPFAMPLDGCSAYIPVTSSTTCYVSRSGNTMSVTTNGDPIRYIIML
ncbi:hypothetical protein [Providencia rettgeri]|uniref:tail fiber/spike domain-containing protein n=2 Tax=Providencia rettgeri TaxID=587 RepID=UPI00155E0C78|nr:hypothetical protein HRD55_08935 [Providencia rettgeri]QNN34835.1 hypothetical protein H9X60_08940 [Providencia rettgeri]